MQIIEVKDQKTAKEFLMLPVRLYKNEKHWIRPLDNDVNNVFDPQKNKYFRHGEITRWILIDGSQTIGRVAAFINKKTVHKDNDQPTGGIGFFECINDQSAADLLFNQCKQWLEQRGMEAMDGPINFGDRDRWWGLLVEGFDKEPNYCMPYNFPYYQQLFENYGFKNYFEQYTYGRKVLNPLSETLAAKADRIARNPAYSFRHIEMKKLDNYTDDFKNVYNSAWAHHSGVPKMSSLQAKNVIKQLKPIMDPEILWFGYYNDEPIAFFIILPEVNQLFKHVNGKMDWLGKIKFLWYKYRKSCRKMYGLVFGIVPDHQGKGVEGALIMAVRKQVQDVNYKYEDFEMNWIGSFNKRMIHLVEQVGAEIAKRHITYRKLFDETKPFKPAPDIKG
ncbi:MAG: hypothetical protein ACNS62_21150 [Candidatus Cyclobacteriaceae bacterium M3_2C_046]